MTDSQPFESEEGSWIMYETIREETWRQRHEVLQRKAAEAERKLSLYALDNILWNLEELNLKERTIVPDDVVEQLTAYGVPYQPSVRIPDLIELVFTRQEHYMNVEPEDPGRVPTLEELEAYFEESRVA
jgi:crotonobetainyl-CoA:carnitine CoA-transferase CaiB-like acyl-CoA transferase